MRRRGWAPWVFGVALLLATADAWAARSGSSFSGRGGFRSAPSTGRSYSGRSYGSGYGYGSGPHVIVTPGWGWGGSPFWGGGYGGCGGLGLGSVLFIVGIGWAASYLLRRTMRRANPSYAYGPSYNDEDNEDVRPGRAFVHEVQLALGRSGRSVQERLAQFAADGNTATEAGLAQLLNQTALELLRQKDSIRYARSQTEGPLPLSSGETRMNALALEERSRFEVERIRGADGVVRRSSAAATTSSEVLEYLVVTIIAATRTPLEVPKDIRDREGVEAALRTLGGVSPDALLGLEVIWSPADPDDSLTESDLLTSYPTLRGV